MFGQDRSQLRGLFFAAWRKHHENLPTEALDNLIIQIILQHPEYHTLLQDETRHLDKDYSAELGETNPFLHMAMHISIQEQLATQRPEGITQHYQSLLSRFTHPHEVEHQMMDCLAEMLWQSQQNKTQPDEQSYLQCLNQRASA